MEKLIELRRQLQLRFEKPGSLREVLHIKSRNPDESFLQKIVRIVETNMADENFDMHQLCKAVNMSRSNLFRKLKALTGKSTTVFIRTLRLEKAKELLETTERTVSEIAFEVGFNSLKYFSRVFQEEFGKPPSEMRKK